MKKIFTALLAFSALWSTAQVTMPVTGNKYVTQCYGVITDDNLGGSGYYSHNADGVLVVNPGMTGSVALTFTAFNCPGDYLYVYSGDYTQGGATLVGSYSYSALPNSGSTINVSGTMSLRFVSNGYTNGTGFQATFFTNLTGTLNANFTGPTAANYNSAVPFVNSSTGSLSYVWDFGDGTTSTEKNPTHQFTQSGVQTVQLIASNCNTSDTITKTITIGSAPNGSVPNDTLKLTANCGYSASTSWTVSNASGAGALGYSLSLDDSALVYNYTFENASIGNFTIPSNVYNATLSTTTATKNSGSRSLQLTGYSYNNPAELDLAGLKPNYIKYATSSNTFVWDAGIVEFKDASGKNILGSTRWRYGDLYITYRGANNVYYYNYYGTFNQGDWVDVEFKNIDWTNKSFDFYIDGTLVHANCMFEDASFSSSNAVLDRLSWVNTASNISAHLDDIIITDDGLEELITIAPSSLSVFGGSSSTMILTADASQLNVGTYYLTALISSNDTNFDGTTMPVELTVTGSSDFTANSNCIYFNQVPVNIGSTDTLEISNTGCDNLLFDSVTTHTNIFSAAFNKSMLAPDSAENLVVTCNATSAGTYLDTVYFYEGSTVHKICLYASFINTAIASVSDTVVYNLEGCPGTFSVPFTLSNTGLANMNWLEGYGAEFLYDKFNSTTAPAWYATPGTRSSGCGTIEGSSSLTLSGYNGMVYLNPLDFSKGGKISFTAGPSSNCYTPSNYTAYYISVQYRTSPTGSWSTIQAVYPNTGNQHYSINLPAAAWSTTTEIRIGATNSYLYGTWLLDNLVVEHRSATDFTPNSGSLTPGSSTTVNANFDFTGYPAGTYYRQVGVASNDPTYPNKTFWVKVLVEGEALVSVAPKLCYDMDTTFMGATSEFDVSLINVGCRAMGIDSVISTSTNLTYAVDTLGAQIGDTATLTMTFIPSATGAFNDSLFVYTTDSAFALCINGYVSMPPVIEMDTTLVSATAVNCGDSITITLPIYNDGSAVLSWEVEQGRPLEVLIIDEYFYPAHLPKLLDLLNSIPKVNVTRANTLSAITARLPKTDLVIFPPITANGQQSYFNTLSSPLTNWMTNEGGKVVLMASSFFNINMSYFSASSTVYTNSALTQYVSTAYTNHPYMANVPSYFTSPAGTYGAYLYNGNTMLSNTYYRESLVTNNIGLGEVIFYGWSFLSTDNNPFRTIMKNIVESTRDSLEQATWLSVSPKNGTAAAGDTGYVSLTFSSEGLVSGTYESMLTVTSNDPSHSGYTIPLEFEVIGSGQFEFEGNACLDFGDIYQNATYSKQYTFMNTGCDSLTIDSANFSLNAGYTDSNSYPLVLAPGDTLVGAVGINVSTSGAMPDTLNLFVDGAAYQRCLDADVLLSPSLSVTPTSIYKKLNKCKGIDTDTVSITNSGLGVANYDLWLGERYEVSSTKFYGNSTYATTTHDLGTLIDTDTLFYEIVLNGGFSSYSGRIYLYFNNSYYGNIYDNNVANGTNDTITGYITGSYLNYLKTLTNITLTVYNNYYVTVPAGTQMHHVRFWQNGTPSWVTLSNPVLGNLNAGATINRYLIFDPTSMPYGTYTTYFNVESNDAANPWIQVPITMEVVNETSIALGTGQINYGTVVGNTPKVDSVLVINDGCQPLTVTNVTSNNSHFVPGWTSASIPVGFSKWLPVTFTATQQGFESGNITINNNDTLQILSVQANAVYAPQSSFTYQVLDSCSGQVAFYDDSQNANSRIWLFGDGGSSSNANPVYNYDKPGNYTVKFVVSNAAGSDTTTQLLELDKVFYVAMDYPDTVAAGIPAQFYDSCMTASTWQWYFGDGGSANVKNPTHTYSNQNTYVVTLQATSVDGCIGSTNKTIVVFSGIGQEEWGTQALSLFPNPTSGRLTIESDEPYETYAIYNAVGERVAQGTFEAVLDVRHLPAGAYTLHLVAAERNAKLKFNVVH